MKEMKEMKEMNKLTGFQVACITAGCVLGAGYVSGQELWQFFGSFGVKGIAGIVFGIAVYAAFVYMIARIADHIGREDMDLVVAGEGHPVLVKIIGGVELLFTFLIIVVMIAGAGSLFEQVFHCPSYIGSVVLTALILPPAFFGMAGMKKVFTLLVPILAVCTLIISALSLWKNGTTLHIPKGQVLNPLLPSAALSAVTFVSYNLLCSIGVLSPLKRTNNKKSLLCGVAMGALFLLMIAISILLPVLNIEGATKEELPMLTVAFSMHPLCGYVYGLLLFMGIYGASVATLTETVTYFLQKKKTSRGRGILLTLGIAALALLLSLFGFSELISIVYPIFGYIGFLVMLLLVIRFVRLRRTESGEATR